jgi:hypothetical protein
MSPTDELRCPLCGEGVVQDLGFDASARTADGRPVQEPEAREWVRYSCGHQVQGARLETADEERLHVERRTSDDTTEAPGGD